MIGGDRTGDHRHGDRPQRAQRGALPPRRPGHGVSAALALPRRPLRLQRRRRRRAAYDVNRPGAYASTPAWWSREHWRSELLSDLQSDEVHELRSAVGSRGPVSVRAIYAVAVAISAAADGATGRNALPGNDALTTKAHDIDDADPESLAKVAASSGYGLTTVQKAVQVLARRGWLVLVRAGKNRLALTERLELWEDDCKARQRRNVWACTRVSAVAADAGSSEWACGAVGCG